KIILSTITSDRNLTQWALPKDGTNTTMVHADDKLMLLEIRKYLNEKLNQSLPTLKELASKFNTNEYKIKSRFKFMFGLPISTYYHQKKLRKTTAMIIESDLPIATIVRQMGYMSVSQFYNTFKDKFGMPPRQYRNIMKKGC